MSLGLRELAKLVNIPNQIWHKIVLNVHSVGLALKYFPWFGAIDKASQYSQSNWLKIVFNVHVGQKILKKITIFTLVT